MGARKHGEGPPVVMTGDDFVCDHWHDEYLTETGVNLLLQRGQFVTESKWKDLMARYIIGAVFGSLLALIGFGVFIMKMEGRVHANEVEISRVARDGSAPVANLRNDLTRLSTQMETLSSDLKETRQAIEKVAK